VTFLDNGTIVTTAPVVSGVAAGTYLSPGMGTHSMAASYGGDANFLASTSQAMTATVNAMPDFTVTSSGAATQTVAVGDVASYGMTVAPQSGAFTGVVDLSVSGLPSGATVSFSPPQVVPGSSSVNVTMSVQTSATLLVREWRRTGGVMLAGLLCPLWMMGRRKRSVPRSVAVCGLLLWVMGTIGCGARSVSTPIVGGKTYTLMVKGTSTNLAGAVVSHAMQVTLVVE
jgi:hypothetical protein